MSEPTGAVFLSYASQEVAAARRACATRRGGGLEVWFDQRELRGGDAWDQKIRQIRDCALFVPVISSSTQSRLEGYFRREWRLAAEKACLVPVVEQAGGSQSPYRNARPQPRSVCKPRRWPIAPWVMRPSGC